MILDLRFWILDSRMSDEERCGDMKAVLFQSPIPSIQNPNSKIQNRLWG
jgi:hypothetical protein